MFDILTFGAQHVIYDWLPVLDVMVTNQPGEVVQNFVNTCHDDAASRVAREHLKMMH